MGAGLKRARAAARRTSGPDQREQDRKAIAFAGLVSVLVDCEVWFRQTADGEEGIHWQNGDSNKYHGNAWDQADKIRKKIQRALDAVK